MENCQSANTPFFSIVMPVYNVERYVADAIGCVIAQTFDDWELIIVDDASPDASIQVVERFAQQDARIKIITHPENRGAPAARNTGMDAASGSYIWFADADDTFVPDLLERVKAEIDATGAQIVLFGLTEQYYDSADKLLYCNEIPMQAARYVSPEDWHGTIIDLEQGTHFGYTFSKIYDLSFLRDQRARFQDLLLAEDFAFNVDAFRNAQVVAQLGGSSYNYRKTDGRSITNSNAYTYAQYYDLVRKRIETLRDLLVEWGVFDDRACSILGSLYGRYVLSAIERTYHANAKIGKAQRLAFIRQVMSDPLYTELIPYAQAKDSKATAMGLKILRSKNAKAAARFGMMINIARTHMYSVFTKIRSGR